jgi:hypothetical protein
LSPLLNTSALLALAVRAAAVCQLILVQRMQATGRLSVAVKRSVRPRSRSRPSGHMYYYPLILRPSPSVILMARAAASASSSGSARGHAVAKEAR